MHQIATALFSTLHLSEYDTSFLSFSTDVEDFGNETGIGDGAVRAKTSQSISAVLERQIAASGLTDTAHDQGIRGGS